MEDTVELTALESLTGLDARTMYAIIVRHYQMTGMNAAITVYGKFFISADFYSQICAQYEELSYEVVSLAELQASKSHLVPFKQGHYIYFLFDGDQLVYIGQSVNVAYRVTQHIESKLFDSVAFIEVDALKKNLVENLNIKAFQPKYNVTVTTNEELFATILKKLFS